MSTSKHSISLNKAKQLISEYRKGKKKILKDEFHNKAVLPDSETFERGAFDSLLAQEGCVAVRFYYGMDEENNVKLVFVGVNADNEDIIPLPTMTDEFSNNTLQLYNSASRCPPECPPDSPVEPND